MSVTWNSATLTTTNFAAGRNQNRYYKRSTPINLLVKPMKLNNKFKVGFFISIFHSNEFFLYNLNYFYSVLAKNCNSNSSQFIQDRGLPIETSKKR